MSWNITDYPLRKVVKVDDRGYYFWLTLECGHEMSRECPQYGKPENRRAPKKTRCLSCGRKAVSV